MFHNKLYDVSEKLFNTFADKKQMGKVDHIQKYFIQKVEHHYNIYRITTHNHKLHVEMDKIRKDKVAGEFGYKFTNCRSRDRFLKGKSNAELMNLIINIDSKRGFKHTHHFEQTTNWRKSMEMIAGGGEFEMVG